MQVQEKKNKTYFALLFAFTFDLKIVSAYKLLKYHTLFNTASNIHTLIYIAFIFESLNTRLESRCLFLLHFSLFKLEGRLKRILLGSQGPHKRESNGNVNRTNEYQLE